MNVDKAVCAVEKHVDEGDFLQAVANYHSELIDDLAAINTYKLKIAYAISACNLKNPNYCAWYNDLWNDKKDGSDASIDMSKAYVHGWKMVDTGSERLTVQIEFPDGLNGSDADAKVANMIRMMTGHKPDRVEQKDPEKKSWELEFRKVDSKRMANLLIRAIAGLTGVVTILEQSNLPFFDDWQGWFRNNLSLARLALILITLFVGILTGQITNVEQAQDVLDGTPLPTVIIEETPTPEVTTTPTQLPEPTATSVPTIYP